MDLKLRNNNSLNFDPVIQLDHITSHSNEYIDTGVLPTDNIKLEMEFSFNSVSGCPYGTQTSSATTQAFQLVRYNGTYYYMLTLGQGTSKTALYTDKRYHVEHKKGMQKLYDTEDSSTLLIDGATGIGTFSSNKSIYLFAKNSNSGVTDKSSINLYWCKIYNSDVIIRDYVPSYNNSKFCLFDKITNTYYYNLGSDDFTSDISLRGSGVAQQITNLFIKDCPETNGINVLRKITIAQTGTQTKLTRVRCNIGNVSGTIEELQYYATLGGYSDNYEEQTKPRIIGTWTLNNWYTNEELENFQGAIDGLTVLGDGTHNLETALENGDFAIQTLDSTKPNYNPAAAIRLNANGYGNVISIPLINNGGRFFISKNDATAITTLPLTLFRQVETVTDDNSIVTNDNTLEYSFITFNEFKYFTGLNIITAGTGTAVTTQGAFGGCTALTSIELPNGVNTIGRYSFYDCTALSRIVLPNTLTKIDLFSFTGCSSMNGGSVYYDGTLRQWMDINFVEGLTSRNTSPTQLGSHLYIGGEELVNLVIPNDITSINVKTFMELKYITSVQIPDTITYVNAGAFYNCGGIINLHKKNMTVVNSAFGGCGGGIGTLEVRRVESPTSEGSIKFKDVLIHEKATASGNHQTFGSSYIYTIRINGNFESTTNNSNALLANNSPNTRFVEIMGQFVGSNGYIFGGTNALYNGCIIHLGNNGIAGASTRFGASYTKLTKIYVGDGSSYQHDLNVFNLYNADTDWSAYCGSGVPGVGKVDLWYNYHGEYRTYNITDNLTNCTNTNPDAWPYITRGESYETTIVPDEGMTIDSLTVEMLDTDTTSPTYDTYIPQPTSYDSDTGVHTVLISSVTGNVIITASAS